MSDKFNLSGDFRGSIVNIKSRLDNVQQAVGEVQAGHESDREELKKLIAQLSGELQKSPPENKEQAVAVAATAQTLVEQVKAPEPNRTLIRISGDGLKQAARDLSEALPTLLPIATQIVATVAKISAGGR